MADRYTIHAVGSMWDIWDNQTPTANMASAWDKSDATRIADALNAVDRLTKAVWGPEGCPTWLEGGAQ